MNASAKITTLRFALWLLLIVCCSPATAVASQTARLKVSLTPERLGGRTTITFSLRVIPHGVAVPSPVLAVNLLYASNIGLVTSGLGLETCDAVQLETLGQCPANSLMGYGRALVAIPFGPEVVREQGQITTWMAPLQDGHLALLFYAVGQTPVLAERIFTAQLLEAPAPYGGQLVTDIPVIPTLPGASDASVIELTTTIGPMDVTYYARFRGKRVPYHPNGLRLPEHCPRGGFPFAAVFTFLD
ncbi:MAG TPA: hypothetical protein VED41_03745, partial [Solirubrobacteraceae bacterium]|nr:hypothetical protein [Solirubrobacteraceae bacterium]